MRSIEAFLYFCNLLDVDPVWPIIILVILVIGCFCPWDLQEKTKVTKDKDGNVEFRTFRLKK